MVLTTVIKLSYFANFTKAYDHVIESIDQVLPRALGRTHKKRAEA